MKFFGKEIPTDKINFVMNVVSFILGVIFFVRMQQKMNQQPEHFNYSAERDSLLTIQARVNAELKEIRQVQDSLIIQIQKDKETVKEQTEAITVKRQQIFYTLHSDWDNLTQDNKDAYVNQLLSNLIKPK
jgi:hypothetical protein